MYLRGLALNDVFGDPTTIDAPVYSYSAPPSPSYDPYEGMYQPTGWDAGAPVFTPGADYPTDASFPASTPVQTMIPSLPRSTVPSTAGTQPTNTTPTASGAPFSWGSVTSLLQTAISSYGNVKVAESKANTYTPAGYPNRPLLNTSPSYSPFPGDPYAAGGGPMQLSTTSLIIGGTLLAGAAYLLTRG